MVPDKIFEFSWHNFFYSKKSEAKIKTHFSVSKKPILFQENSKMLSGTICSRAKIVNKALDLKFKHFKD
jgi:hypothetical protein